MNENIKILISSIIVVAFVFLVLASDIGKSILGGLSDDYMRVQGELKELEIQVASSKQDLDSVYKLLDGESGQRVIRVVSNISDALNKNQDAQSILSSMVMKENIPFILVNRLSQCTDPWPEDMGAVLFKGWGGAFLPEGIAREDTPYARLSLEHINSWTEHKGANGKMKQPIFTPNHEFVTVEMRLCAAIEHR